MFRTIWFSFEDEEAELHDIPQDTSISTLRRRLHEGKIFRFPTGAAQTDLQIGRMSGEKFEKFKARNDLDDINFKKDETLMVRIKKRKYPLLIARYLSVMLIYLYMQPKQFRFLPTFLYLLQVLLSSRELKGQ